jgi:polygalacturonase
MRIKANLPREADNPPDAPLKWPRPRLVNLIRCRDVLIEGVELDESPFYNLHLLYCEDVIVRRVTSRRRLQEHNTNIVLDSSKRVRIDNCAMTCGGDAIGIKSGYNEDGRRVGIGAEDIVIANCHMFDTGASGLTIGSETAGGVRNVLVSNCVIEGVRDAIYIRAPRGRGGTVEQVRVTNLTIDRVEEAAVKLSNFFDAVRKEWFKGSARRDLQISRSRPAPIDAGTPTFRDFSFSGLTMGKVRDVAVVEGLPERYVTGVVFQDVTVAEARGGLVFSLAADVSVSNVALGRSLEAAAAVDAREVERLEVHRLRYPRPLADVPAVWLENVVGAFVHGCQIGPAGAGYQWLEQAQSRLVELGANAAPALTPAAPAAQKG